MGIKKNSSCKRITVVTHAFHSRLSSVFYSSFIKIFEPICDELLVVTGNFHLEHTRPKVHIENVHSVKEHRPWLAKIIEYVWAYFAICMKLARTRPHTIIFVQGSSALALPLLLSRLLKSKVVLIVLVSNDRVATYTYKGLLLRNVISTISRLLININYTFSNKIIVPTESLVSYFGLERHKHKILCGNYSMFLSDAFRVKKDFHARGNIVGLVGRLNNEKGCLEFVRAIPLILLKKKDVRFLVIGEGPLENEMKKELEKSGCRNKVDFLGVVPHEAVAEYFNQMKFHILPSHTEALSVTVVEAMACGTIVIANSVGGVSDVVVNDQTGFLLENNLPSTIANKVIDVQEHADLDSIRKNALEFVEQNVYYEKVVENWKKLLRSL
jgi:glycosyltransferase involved in cell wall biosynthesis